MRLVRPSDPGSIERLVEALRPAEPTYTEIGFTLTGKQPSNYRNDRYEAELGQGEETFRRAVEGLRCWRAHRLPGIQVLPMATDVQPGATVILTLGTPVVSLAAPCRIIEVVDGPSQWGFAYGTLPGHPEQGEESFLVSISGDGAVRLEIAAFSRLVEPAARLLGPIGRGVQVAVTRGYIRALQRIVSQGV